MRHFFRNKYVFLLLILLCVRFPVYADTLSGNESEKAAGQTSVTARVELPEDYEPGESEESDGIVHTGDDGQVMVYVFAILLSTAAIVLVLCLLTK